MKDLIQWPRAKYWTAQWNPVIGCRPASPACANCYAAAWARRFGQSFDPHQTKQRTPRRGVVFCGNMTDLFGEWRTCGESAADIGAARVAGKGADYLWLTKRVRRMAAALGYESRDEEFPDVAYANHWFGFTAEDRARYNERMEDARRTLPKWARLWISAEPLLGPIDMGFRETRFLPDLVVVGCESGPNRRPCKVGWIESIVDQCLAAHIPVFVKQISLCGKCVADINQFPAHLRIRQVPWAGRHEEAAE
ncbi:MAG: DUF5131 family protein [Kiritimatiellae bacterium]|nr:DUF5131 family protein [Kiritimatiellia bacterium]